MPATSFQTNGEQARIALGGEKPIGQPGRLTARRGVRDDRTGPPPAHQVMRQTVVFPRRPALDHGQIALLDFPFAKLGAESGGRLGRAGQHHHPGHRCVEPVHDPGKDPTRLVVTHLEPCLGQLVHRGPARCVALHNHAGWFIRHQQVIVLIKDGPARMKKDHRTTSPPNQKNRRGPIRSRPMHRGETEPGPLALAAIFDSCGIALSQRQIDQLWLYHTLLRRHNTELNLTRIHNFGNMVLKLYVDSVLPAQLTRLPSPLMDLGTGPGMPGIPLKILHPELTLRLAEGRGKRVAFLHEVLAGLSMEGLDIIERAITPTFDEPVNGVITRAVETMDQTLARIENCLSEKGRVIFMKGPGCDPEIAEALHRFDRRYALVEDRAYRIGDTRHERRLVVFERLDTPPRAIAATAARRHPVQALTSEQNSRFKSLKKLLTGRGVKKAGQALLAGARPVAEMITAFPERCLAWISSGSQDPPPEDSPATLQWLQLSEPLFQALDIFGTHAPLLLITVADMAPWSPEEEFPEGCSLLVPFQDPENIGAIIRSAAAFDVNQVILLAESAHPYHPKALRAAGGVTPKVRLRQGPSLKNLPDDLPIVALSAEGRNIDRADLPKRFGLLAGLEGEGLPDQWRERSVCISISKKVESLNAATATAIALYEWRRRQSLA